MIIEIFEGILHKHHLTKLKAFPSKIAKCMKAKCPKIPLKAQWKKVKSYILWYLQRGQKLKSGTECNTDTQTNVYFHRISIHQTFPLFMYMYTFMRLNRTQIAFHWLKMHVTLWALKVKSLWGMNDGLDCVNFPNFFHWTKKVSCSKCTTFERHFAAEKPLASLLSHSLVFVPSLFVHIFMPKDNASS